ncbi:type II secretion system protein [Shewanella baltica]|uniref:type II secretion system protein n=1 Tax=Shewanella baltica TaxID=62322 RepID=UPI00217EA710|nr:type II secretion system protein [Shewanella baltica]MCS6128528.1 type II secretion system protein [Shewanella baltica]MCS6140490.1 type II secretion system protein [Shewanella baltica]MCS6146742.1 type II secretion system protein [Shewanella baltica]MCS6171272.1 type II secretion system protein [Shewanella baltica]MCS6188496.1 type II secretion system protein [Shewanella baltica]
MQMSLKKHVQGFTLIELVVVIIILGILAVIAAPKFMNLQRDAKVNAVKGYLGQMQDMTKMLHMKAQIVNTTGDDVTIATQYGDYQFYAGFPETKSESTSPNLYFLETFMDLGVPKQQTKDNTKRQADYGDIQAFEDNDYSRLGYGTGDLTAGQCYAEYHHTSTGHSFLFETDGC